MELFISTHFTDWMWPFFFFHPAKKSFVFQFDEKISLGSRIIRRIRKIRFEIRFGNVRGNVSCLFISRDMEITECQRFRGISIVNHLHYKYSKVRVGKGWQNVCYLVEKKINLVLFVKNCNIAGLFGIWVRKKLSFGLF